MTQDGTEAGRRWPRFRTEKGAADLIAALGLPVPVVTRQAATPTATPLAGAIVGAPDRSAERPGCHWLDAAELS